jgi:hypothetical protein
LWEKVRYEGDRQEKNSKEKVVFSGGPTSPPIYYAPSMFVSSTCSTYRH